jgi:hypothetical protein
MDKRISIEASKAQQLSIVNSKNKSIAKLSPCLTSQKSAQKKDRNEYSL